MNTIAFYQKIDGFIFSLHRLHLTYTEKEELKNQIVKYTLGLIEQHTIKATCKNLHCYEEFRYFKHNYLDVSHYLNKELWKEILKKLKGLEYNYKDDVTFCLDCLSQKDIDNFKCKNLNRNIEQLDLNAANWLFLNKMDIYGYIQSKVRKLSFLTLDPSLDKEDLIQELICEVIKTLNSFQRRYRKNDNKAPLKAVLDKYIDTAISNKITILIEHYTCQKRKYLNTDHDDEYIRLKRLRKQKKTKEVKEMRNKLSNASNSYYNAYSDVYLNEYQDQVSNYEIVNSYLWIEGIKQDISDPRIKDFIDIITYGNDDFEKWAEENELETTRLHNTSNAAKRYIDQRNEKGDYDNVLTYKQKQKKWQTYKEIKKHISRVI